MWFWIQIIIIILIIACLWRVVSYYLKKYTEKIQKDWLKKWEEHNRWLRHEVRMSHFATNSEMKSAINRLNYLEFFKQDDLPQVSLLIGPSTVKGKHTKEW